MADAIRRCQVRLHAYCWMTNHLHALMQVAQTPLGKSMQRIAMRYSRYRHRQLHTTGHLFERRYRARLVDVDAYFLVLLRYIHLNPIKAGIVSDPADYRWSSHQAYLGRESYPWLTTDFGLSLFGPEPGLARDQYLRFIGEPHDSDSDELAEQPHHDDPRIIGTDRFVQQLPGRIERPRSSMTLAVLAERVCANHRFPVAQLRAPGHCRALTAARVDLARQALAARIATLHDIAEFIARDPSSLYKLLARHELHRPAEGS